MLFNSEAFLFWFLPAALLGFFLCRRFVPALAIPLLVIASLVFYAQWKLSYLFILLASVGFNYGAYLLLEKQSSRRTKHLLVALAVAANLGLLGFYKYSGFFVNDVLHLPIAGFEAPLLPLAISFFTFQQIAFIVDEAYTETKRVRFDEYAAFVTFFPQLIAGPIVRHDELIPQLKAPRPTGFFLAGTVMFLIGLSKKVLIADTFARWASAGFASPSELTMSDAWLAALSYTMQLYFDFSGYSDMAIGLGLLFGFRLPQNFNSPYKAKSLQDFWQRWHMTLSRWLRDYLYIPLGGNRRGKARTYLNLFLTMLLGGLWHGAAWTFVVWGALHGAALALNRVWSRLGIGIWTPIAWMMTFVFIVFTWVFFRAESIGDAVTVSAAMLGGQGFGFVQGGVVPLFVWGLLAAFVVIVRFAPNSHQITDAVTERRGPLVWFALFLVGIVGTMAVKRLMETSVPSEFLYFQF